mgnify:CR=1 FL=1
MDRFIEVENAVNIRIITNNTDINKDNITLTINGKTYSVSYVSGEYVVSIAGNKNLISGEYNITVSIPETTWYYSASNSTNYTVFKHS